MEHQIKKMEEKEVEKAGEIASIAEVAVVKCSDYKQEKVDKAEIGRAHV